MIDKDFLLKNKTAKKLFFDYADKQPIFDFHCHLSPKAIYENGKFADLTEAWLGGNNYGDHYKWRAMRSMGIPENSITGNADGFEKFKLFAKTLQYAIGNPLYHWAHLELQRYFDIYEPLTEKNAKEIYDKVNEKLKSDDFRVRDFIKNSNVKIIFTTDDPIDTLEYHKLIKEDASFETKVLPAFRPDKALNADAPGFREYIGALSDAASVKIESYSDLLKAFESRIDFFDKMGCRASDHAFGDIPFAPASQDEVSLVFKKALDGEVLSSCELDIYKTALIQFLAAQYAQRGWVMEIHMGIIRNNNTRMFEKLGPDTGFDTVGDYSPAANLAKLLNSIEINSGLPKTILFCGNPNDNVVISTILGCFQSEGAVSKIQFGTAWWFNDHIDGMTSQMRSLASMGVLGKFIGMLTDSRSFLSYPRHEYFRRILCNLIGEWIENGEYADDIEFAGQLVNGICYGNAIEYFNMK